MYASQPHMPLAWSFFQDNVLGGHLNEAWLKLGLHCEGSAALSWREVARPEHCDLGIEVLDTKVLKTRAGCSQSALQEHCKSIARALQCLMFMT